FTDNQIQQYLQLKQARNPRFDYAKALKNYPELKAIITTPLLLSMVVELLPHDASNQMLSRYAVYAFFMKRTYALTQKRLMQSVGIPPGVRNIQAAFERYAQQLAYAFLVKEQTISITDAHFFAQDIDTEQARRACPIAVHDQTVVFRHMTYAEFYAANYIVEHVL
ncbi:MAG: hypothetical protein GWO10_21295, partial [candidate division Zixibacteria bacterium]|nr:hypothetical protein [Gammaproteobacteria bacterium]NIR25991.1 hypothetical protein [Gammaproteobacteria bacterium]NIR66236.1 hypothetical protein [candidate division Zixibacteria bacterium]